MPLKLYFHPLASFCHKALIALYEGGIAFEPIIVNLGDPASTAAFKAVWPIGKMPVLRDDGRDRTVAESTIVIEYLDAFYPGAAKLVPGDADLAWQTRLWDRIYDHYVQEPMQKIVAEALRPPGRTDPHGVEQARAQLVQAYALIEDTMRSDGRIWAVGSNFSLADCSAAPALFYANTVLPFGDSQKALRAYLRRLMARPSFARVLAEAQPYFGFFPLEPKPQITPPNP